ncbi:MAG: hypothetical protein Q4A71_05675 [Actinomycetaceae bacterium]|nr:hypothetical protein [Actinomycetaceae bacterium]
MSEDADTRRWSKLRSSLIGNLPDVSALKSADGTSDTNVPSEDADTATEKLDGLPGKLRGETTEVTSAAAAGETPEVPQITQTEAADKPAEATTEESEVVASAEVAEAAASTPQLSQEVPNATPSDFPEDATTETKENARIPADADTADTATDQVQDASKPDENTAADPDTTGHISTTIPHTPLVATVPPEPTTSNTAQIPAVPPSSNFKTFVTRLMSGMENRQDSTEANTAAFQAILMGEDAPPVSPQSASFLAAPETQSHAETIDEDDATAAADAGKYLIDPQKTSLIGAGVTLVVLFVLGIVGIAIPLPGSHASAASSSATPTPVKTPSKGGKNSEPSGKTKAKATPPEIAAVAALDPEGDHNEHPELQERMYDGNPSSIWYSRFYANPKFGVKSGIGIQILLKAKTAVSQITLHTPAEGGIIEVRAVDASHAKEGSPLVKTTFKKPETVIKLPAGAQTDSLVLWIPELPVDDEGKNRVVVSELSVQ